MSLISPCLNFWSGSVDKTVKCVRGLTVSYGFTSSTYEEQIQMAERSLHDGITANAFS